MRKKSFPSLNVKFKCSIIFCLILLGNEAYSQNINEVFRNDNCEYLQLLNDSVVQFALIGGHKGSIAEIYQGVGKYKLEYNQLFITIGEFYIDTLQIINKWGGDINCSNVEKIDEGIYKLEIEKISDDSIVLIGPIIDNYQALNKQRFFRLFINWPWKWSFKKQHWHDPRIRELYRLN
jgi:hypothetical protein